MDSNQPDNSLPAWQGPTRRTKPPNPGWRWGDTVDSTEEGKKWLAGVQGGWETFDAEQLGFWETVSICLSGVVPRPIGFISTTSKEGVDNLSPYAYFTVASHQPLVLCFSSDALERGVKDTVRNADETGEFVVNIASDLWGVHVHVSSMNSPPSQEEWGFAGLTKEPSSSVRPPRVRESGVSFECKLWKNMPIVNPKTSQLSSNMIFGEVTKIHIRKDMLTHSPNHKLPQVDPTVLRPLARMGDVSYASIGDIYRLPMWEWNNSSEQALEGAKMREDSQHGSTDSTSSKEPKH